MNINPSTPPPISTVKPDRFIEESLPGNPGMLSIMDAILKRPGQLVYELRKGRAARVALSLLAVTLVCLGVYGLMTGSMSGGGQLWIAPAKVILGAVLTALICLPSLYIFLCLGGVDAHLREIAGGLLAMICLMSLLLLGLAPVAWVFSQSTDSVAFMAMLHIFFWIIGLFLGSRMLLRPMAARGSVGNARLWMVIYFVVCLQMMTALRPIIGRAETFLPQEKKFFLAHWAEMMGGR